MAKLSLIGLLVCLATLLGLSPTARAAPCTANGGATIAAAGRLTVGGCETGGGQDIAFRKISLTGGDRVQLTVPGSTPLELDLYPGDTTDASFSRARPADLEVTVPAGASSQVLTVQAPYTGTFLVAACQPVDFATNGGDCRGIQTGQGRKYTLPMKAYTFTSAALGNACTTPPPRAGASIAAAPSLTIGACESGGSSDLDYWLVAMNDGDQLQVTVPPATADVLFDLYPPGTTDASWTQTTPTDSELAAASQGGATPQVAVLTASAAGTYALVACEPKPAAAGSAAARDCRGIATGDGAGFVLPMRPYTFTTATIPSVPYGDSGSYYPDDGFGPYGDTQSDYGKLSIAKQTASVSKTGALRLTVRCATTTCNGTLKLTAVATTSVGHGKKRRVRKTLATADLTYLDTGTTHVSLTLTKAGLRLLRHASHGRLKATATLKYDTGTSSTTSKTAHAAITLRKAKT